MYDLHIKCGSQTLKVLQPSNVVELICLVEIEMSLHFWSFQDFYNFTEMLNLVETKEDRDIINLHSQ